MYKQILNFYTLNQFLNCIHEKFLISNNSERTDKYKYIYLHSLKRWTYSYLYVTNSGQLKFILVFVAD